MCNRCVKFEFNAKLLNIYYDEKRFRAESDGLIYKDNTYFYLYIKRL